VAATDESLIGSLNSAFSLRRVAWSHDRRARAPDSSGGEPLVARSVQQRVRDWQRTGSFSSLVRRELEGWLDPDEGRDRDELVDDDKERARVPAESERKRITLDGFPRGRRTGDMFHDLFEHIDFASVTEADLEQMAVGKLVAYGFDPELGPQMARAVRETLDTPLKDGLELRQVSARQKLAELEFRLPVLSALTRQRLANVFRLHPSAALAPGYADRVERLDFKELRGFLKGYVDLVFEHAGLWYVVDYKTNHLGDYLDEYAVGAMRHELAQSHYFLQYHLYTLALDRYLRHWQPGYDYERHFGGVLYLFVKGMRPGEPTGVFFEKPPRERLVALSEAIS
jgi:exodeoxyribonuclease V beta subunit